MNKTWIKGLDSSEKMEVQKRLSECSDILLRLSQIIKDKTEATQSKQLTLSYDLPAWSENQADLLGYMRALKEIQILITEKD